MRSGLASGLGGEKQKIHRGFVRKPLINVYLEQGKEKSYEGGLTG